MINKYGEALYVYEITSMWKFLINILFALPQLLKYTLPHLLIQYTLLVPIMYKEYPYLLLISCVPFLTYLLGEESVAARHRPECAPGAEEQHGTNKGGGQRRHFLLVVRVRSRLHVNLRKTWTCCFVRKNIRGSPQSNTTSLVV